MGKKGLAGLWPLTQSKNSLSVNLCLLSQDLKAWLSDMLVVAFSLLELGRGPIQADLKQFFLEAVAVVLQP